MTNVAILVAFCLGLTGAESASRIIASPPSESDATSLRALAEIDHDPATFTAEEQRKFSLLQQVLGASPTTPQPEFAQFGS